MKFKLFWFWDKVFLLTYKTLLYAQKQCLSILEDIKREHTLPEIPEPPRVGRKL